MVDGTRSQDIKRLDESIRLLSEKHEESMACITDLVTNLSLKYDQLAEKVNPNLGIPWSTGLSLNFPVLGNTNMQWQSRFTKLEFPKFFGKDPEGWVYKSENFFEINGIEETQKVKLASIHQEKSPYTSLGGLKSLIPYAHGRILSGHSRTDMGTIFMKMPWDNCPNWDGYLLSRFTKKVWGITQ